MGVSFTTYLCDFRLNIAARLLVTTDDSILSIAESCGFFNLSYFNRTFKKKYGVTPESIETVVNRFPALFILS